MNQVLFEHELAPGRIVRVVKGDLTVETTDAIVNAANEQLQHGGGVAGAMSRKGGRIIQQESNQWVRDHGPVKTGTAAITGAGDLPAKFIIHAVGPVWGSGNDEAKLGSAVLSALTLADAHRLKSISIPGISSGIFGGPKDICARVITQAALDYVAENPKTGLEEIRFCNIDEPTAAAFLEAAKRLLLA